MKEPTTASTPTLDRFTSDACRIAAELQADLISSDSPDDVAELAWRAAEAAVPGIDPEGHLDEEVIEAVTESFVELARIVLRGGRTEIRTIMAAAAIEESRTDFQLAQLLLAEAAKDQDVDRFLANAGGAFEAFRSSALFFIVNAPGGTLSAAFDLVLGLTDDDWEEIR